MFTVPLYTVNPDRIFSSSPERPWRPRRSLTSTAQGAAECSGKLCRCSVALIAARAQTHKEPNTLNCHGRAGRPETLLRRASQALFVASQVLTTVQDFLFLLPSNPKGKGKKKKWQDSQSGLAFLFDLFKGDWGGHCFSLVFMYLFIYLFEPAIYSQEAALCS